MKKFTTTLLNNLLIRDKISYAKIFLCVAFCFLSNSVKAKEDITSTYKNEIAEIEQYLNNIKNLSTKFTQESSGGAVVEGKFYLSRPGKMRIEYLSQPKILIVVNGSILSYMDIELEEISHISTNTTPASFLTRPNISFFAKDVEITDIKKNGDQFAISVMKKNRKEAGEFTLIFKLNPLEFIRMEVKNDMGDKISVNLLKPDFTTDLANSLFVIKNKNLF